MYEHLKPLQDRPNVSQKKRWVINLPSTPLIPTQEMLLAHGSNFAVTSKNPPILEYITSIELACQSLNISEAEELRSDIYMALRHSNPPRPT